jgi:hypothetical protein
MIESYGANAATSNNETGPDVSQFIVWSGRLDVPTNGQREKSWQFHIHFR